MHIRSIMDVGAIWSNLWGFFNPPDPGTEGMKSSSGVQSCPMMPRLKMSYRYVKAGDVYVDGDELVYLPHDLKDTPGKKAWTLDHSVWAGLKGYIKVGSGTIIPSSQEKNPRRNTPLIQPAPEKRTADKVFEQEITKEATLNSLDDAKPGHVLTVKDIATLQLYMGQQLAGTKALQGIGQEWRKSQREIDEEYAFRVKVQAELQKEMEQHPPKKPTAKPIKRVEKKPAKVAKKTPRKKK